MKKRTIIFATSAFAFTHLVSLPVSANEQVNAISLSKSFISTSGADSDDIAGVNAKYYRYADGQPGGFMASLTIADDTSNTSNLLGQKQNTDITYVSFGAGPLYRLNDRLTAFGMAGLSATSVEHSDPRRKGDDMSFMLGAGLKVDLLPRLGIDVHYETSWLDASRITVGAHVLNAGLVYSF